MTNYWQCSKCKKTSIIKMAQVTIRKNGDKIKIPDNRKIDDITCCDRVMRNLSESEYRNESIINDKGLRG